MSYTPEQFERFFQVLNAEADRRFEVVTNSQAGFPEVYNTLEYELYLAIRDLADSYQFITDEFFIVFTPEQLKKLKKLRRWPWYKIWMFGWKSSEWPKVPKSQSFISRLKFIEQIYWLEVVNRLP